MNSHRFLTIVFLGMLLSACGHKQYRTEMPLESALKHFECAVDSAAQRAEARLLVDSAAQRAEARPLCEDPKSAGLEDRKCTAGESSNYAECQSIQHRYYQSYLTEDEREVVAEAAGIAKITNIGSRTVFIERDEENIEVKAGDWVKQSDKLFTGTGTDGDVSVTFSKSKLPDIRNNRVLEIGKKGDGDKTKVIKKEVISGNYYLSFVEFDDQGWFTDRKQMEALFALLEKLKKEDQEVLINVYAHGWKHNASPCDNNVVCFSRVLERHDIAEQVYVHNIFGTQPRTVVGVYIGWRGLPFGTFLNNVSFWARKDAAARVGRGGVFELLTRLNDYRDNRQNGETDPKKTQLVITGHSFGGLVIYEALSHALMERAARTKKIGDPSKDHLAESFGDFVMLVNPAFEGSLYEPLFHIATNRCYEEKQRPVMMVVTSDADSDTRVLFPIGRTLSTIFQHKKSPAQADSMHMTVGHDPRYQTHCLALNGKDLQEPPEIGGIDCKLAKAEIPEKPTKVDESDCGCRYLKATSEFDINSMIPDYLKYFGERIDQSMNSPDQSMNSPDQYTSEKVELKPVLNWSSSQNKSQRYVSSYPYLVVKTDANFIPDHNSIYNDRFINFAQSFFLHHIVESRPLPGNSDKCRINPQCMTGGLPSEYSCQQADGSPYSKYK